MSLKPSPWSTSRTGGCTLTGALSLTSAIHDCISIVHGPAGCAHHNFSLLHATALDQDSLPVASIRSTGLLEEQIIFGGEQALEQALQVAAKESPGMIAVLSTCVSETIGDDIKAVVSGPHGVPVVMIPTAGFLGGDFQQGVNKALLSLSELAAPAVPDDTPTAVLVGEKNLEFEVEQHYEEMARLLSLLGVRIRQRFVRNTTVAEIRGITAAGLNILRDEALVPVGQALLNRNGIPYIGTFPTGFSSTLTFLRETAAIFGLDPEDALDHEKGGQADIIDEFSDLEGSRISFGGIELPDRDAVEELVSIFRLHEAADGNLMPVPVPFPVGTRGIGRLLHRWRRTMNAGM